MTADTVGGVWTYALELGRALGRHNVQIVLATMGDPPTSEQRMELRSIPNMRLQTSDFKLEWMDDPWEDVERAGQWLMRLERLIQPDLVHLNGYAHGALAWRSPCVVVGHSCVLSWWESVKGEPAPDSWMRYRGHVSAGLRAARLVLAPSETMLDALHRHYGPLPPSRVVFNSRAPELFRRHRKEPFIFAAGRAWDEAKNITALDSVAPRLRWPVFVAGAQEHPDSGVQMLSNVHALGRLGPQVLPEWYARASIYALPARYEPFGLSALEAALSGCALVLGDIPSLREVWGDAALFVPPDDHNALERTINSLIDDNALLTQMADRAIERARIYTPERQAAQYLSAISSLATGAAVAGG